MPCWLDLERDELTSEWASSNGNRREELTDNHEAMQFGGSHGEVAHSY